MRNIPLHVQKTRKRSSLFFEIGLIIALGISLWAFNISGKTTDVVVYPSSEDPWNDSILLPIHILDEQNARAAVKPKPQHRHSGVATGEEEFQRQTVPGITGIEGKSLDNGFSNLFDLLKKKSDDQHIYDKPLFKPVFPGGPDALTRFLQTNLTYPPLALENGIQGLVWVSFVIEKDGSISNIRVEESIGWGCDIEAIRVLKSMPRWTPAMHNGKPVRALMKIPIRFVTG